MSQTKRISAIASAIFALITLFVAFFMMFLVETSNCGGNSAAISVCKNYVHFLMSYADEHEGRRFHYGHANQVTREQLRKIATESRSWLKDARFFVKINDVSIEPSAVRRVIMVCDHPYSNVPKRRIGSNPPVHAVAYSTGEMGFISTAEFARLDLAEFVDFRNLETDDFSGSEDGTED